MSMSLILVGTDPHSVQSKTKKLDEKHTSLLSFTFVTSTSVSKPESDLLSPTSR